MRRTSDRSSAFGPLAFVAKGAGSGVRAVRRAYARTQAPGWTRVPGTDPAREADP